MALSGDLTDLVRWSQSLLDRLDALATEGTGRTVNPIPFDLAQTPDALLVWAYLPGFRREDVHVEVRDRRLTIQAERLLPQRDDLTWLRVEAPYGRFLRTLTLGPEIAADQIQASWHDGVLMLRLPRTEEARPRAIPIAQADHPALHDAPSSEATG